MKSTILVGILGVVIGFLAGRSQEPGTENVEKKAVVKSERRGGERARRSGGEGSRNSRQREGKRMITEAVQVGDDLSEISRARLMKWILELEAGDFPEVLEELAKLGGSNNDDPFATDSGRSDYLTVAMARWYELEGEAVLNWVLTGPEEIGEWDEKSLLREMIEDGYGRDPDRSFDLMKKYVGTSEGIPDSWLYQVGKWSRNFKSELVELMASRPDPDVALDDPFAASFNVVSFIEGILDGEREVEFREWLIAEKNEPLLDMLDSMLEQKRVNELKEKGWQALKGAIDRGDLQGSDSAEEVFESWWQEDERAAVNWYLRQEVGAEERAEMIWDVAFVMSKTPQVDQDPFYEGFRDLNRSIVFLNEMKGRGEPVDQAWEKIAMIAIELRQWDQVEKMKSHLPLNVWNETVRRIEGAALDSDRLSIGSNRVTFRSVDESGEAVLERFGMKEQVLEKVAQQNEENLRKLHQILGVEGD